MIREIESCGRRLKVCGSEQANEIVYVIGEYDRAEEISRLLSDTEKSFVFVSSEDWNDELSPWKAKAAFGKGGDFGGGAKDFLDELTLRVIPFVESEILPAPKKRGIVGYSLAGLFAIWSLYNCEAFDKAASASGSMWFDGFTEYVKGSALVKKPELVYFSLGDREKLTKNPRMKRVEECTEEVCGLLSGLGVKTFFEFNSGGHFNDVEVRIAKALRSI